MPSEMKRKIGCFTADFRDGKVTVDGETFSSGFLFVNAMNEYWKPYSGDDGENFEIAQKLLVMKIGAKVVRDELTLGYLYPPHAEKLYFERVMRVQAEYMPVEKKKNTFEVGRRVSFERFGDFLFADFFEGLHVGHYPLCCGVCKQYFLQTTAHRRKYCDGYAPDDPKGRSCEAYAARSNRLAKELAADHPGKSVYNTRRGTIYKHFQRGKITLAESDTAKRHIENLLDKAMMDNNYFLKKYATDMQMDAVYAAVGITPR